MELALFTPGAYIWPVLRNFEVFIASLGSAGGSATRLGQPPLYPASQRFVPDSYGRSDELDARLLRLHSELYKALLRPSSFFDGDERSFADIFLPDLPSTSTAELLDAFFFCFVRRPLAGLPVKDGLAVLRAVFFSHESAEPQLWLYYARERLGATRAQFPLFDASLTLPAATRVQDLAFCATADRFASPRSTGRCWGQIARRPSGELTAEVHCGLDPSLEGSPALEAARPQIEAELRAIVYSALGIEELQAA